MIKLKDIKVEGVCHANIFTYGNERGNRVLEGIDMILYIDYNVDKEISQLENYQLDEEELNDLEDTFASYMTVFLEDDLYKRLDKMRYEDLDYRIFSDVCPGVEATEQEISEEQQKVAFKMIKEYIATEQFRRELNSNLKL